MGFSKYVTLNNPDTDYRRLDKPTLQNFSELLSGVLAKYECTYAQNNQFTISTSSNTMQEDMSKFDERFDNRAVYDAFSFFVSGRTPDKSKKLNIIVTFNFRLSKPTCNISIDGNGITTAQQTDIVEAIGNFIYEATKVDLPTTGNNPANKPPAKAKNTKSNKLSKKVNATTVAEILAIATALITLVAVVIDKFF